MRYRKFDEQNAREELLSGVQIEEPSVFLNWDIKEDVFVEKFVNADNFREHGYFVGNIIFLGQHCNMGVSFSGTVDKISFGRDDYSGEDGLIKSFHTFQTALEKAFGSPTKRKPVLDHFESCVWDISDEIKIRHYVMDRFGLAEYLYIQKLVEGEA